MLLAADADGFDFGGDGFGVAKRATDAAGDGVAPGVGMLFFCAGWKVGEEIVFLSCGGEDFAVACVNDEDFGGLSAAIDAEEKISHIRYSSETGIGVAGSSGWGNCKLQIEK